MTPYDDVYDDEPLPPPVTQVTVGVEDDAPCEPPHTQLVISLAEAKTMVRMPGGITFVNWLRIRGLLDEPMQES